MSVINESEWMPAAVVEVGKWQKYLIWLILFQVISIVLFFALGAGAKGIGVDAIGLLLMVARVVLTAFSLYCVYQMAKSLRKGAAIIYTLGMFLPFISLLVLAHLSAEATRILQANGVHVGIMGADQSDLERLIAEQ